MSVQYFPTRAILVNNLRPSVREHHYLEFLSLASAAAHTLERAHRKEPQELHSPPVSSSLSIIIMLVPPTKEILVYIGAMYTDSRASFQEALYSKREGLYIYTIQLAVPGEERDREKGLKGRGEMYGEQIITWLSVSSHSYMYNHSESNTRF